MKQQNLNSVETTLTLNIAEFLTEYFTSSTSAKGQFSYGLLWDAITSEDPCEIIYVLVGDEQKEDGNFYYEYGLLKAEEEMKADCEVVEINICGTWVYKICYENPDEKSVSFYFYTKTRIMAFIQHENETLEVAWEMQEITQQKPILCLESHTRLFRSALDSILEAYSVDYYSEEDLQREFCPDNTEVASWMRYEFKSDKYAAECAIEDNVGHAIDAAWTWFRTGYMNNFISKDPETNLLHLNWLRV